MTIQPRHLILTATSLLFFASGCDEKPVSYSSPVGIELKADSDKVIDGALTNDKEISTENGNPYASFVSAARERLGRDPGLIEISRVTALLGADSTGVTGLGQIFDGRVDILFEMNSTNDTIPVAHATIDAAVTGSAPVVFTIDFDGTSMVGLNMDDLLDGKFRVAYRGPVEANFASLNAKTDLQITLSFEAFD